MPSAELTDEIRCFCSKRTLLAKCGVDAAGAPFVWQKIFKQGRVFGEMVALGGRVQLRCRDCGRWTEVLIRREILAARVDDPEIFASPIG